MSRSLLILATLLLSPTVLAGPVNVNTATAEQLQAELLGIGPVLAARIVMDRQLNGPYASPAELTRVPLIGPGTLNNNRGWILVD